MNTRMCLQSSTTIVQNTHATDQNFNNVKSVNYRLPVTAENSPQKIAHRMHFARAIPRAENVTYPGGPARLVPFLRLSDFAVIVKRSYANLCRIELP